MSPSRLAFSTSPEGIKPLRQFAGGVVARAPRKWGMVPKWYMALVRQSQDEQSQ
jgi:hypothetical protein